MFGIGEYLYNKALNTKTSKEFVLKRLLEQQTDEEKKQKEENIKWLRSNSKDTYIKATNNGSLKLHAYEVKNEQTDTWVIVIHGYMADGSFMSDYAHAFYDRGYNVLVPDLRRTWIIRR